MHSGLLESNNRLWDCYRSIYKERSEINAAGLCHHCRYNQRSNWVSKDHRYNNHYSNFIIGFSTDIVPKDLDNVILIVAESHGGGREREFRDSWSMKKEIKNLGDYYRCDRIVNFHQLAMRYLFQILDEQSIPWIFTDLVKCFVYKGDKDGGKRNWKIAIDNCARLLDKQINAISPSKIIVLGGEVRGRYFGIRKRDWSENTTPHGAVVVKDFKNTNRKLSKSVQHLVLSYFPSQFTADDFLEKGWNDVVASLVC